MRAKQFCYLTLAESLAKIWPVKIYISSTWHQMQSISWRWIGCCLFIVGCCSHWGYFVLSRCFGVVLSVFTIASFAITLLRNKELVAYLQYTPTIVWLLVFCLFFTVPWVGLWLWDFLVKHTCTLESFVKIVFVHCRIIVPRQKTIFWKTFRGFAQKQAENQRNWGWCKNMIHTGSNLYANNSFIYFEAEFQFSIVFRRKFPFGA